MTQYTSRRLARLEARLNGRRVCETCYGHPVRLVSLHDGGSLISDTMPDDQCPACGRPVRSQIRIVGVDALEV